MAGTSKKCIACAELIRAEAMLCKFCKTLQDDPRYLADSLDEGRPDLGHSFNDKNGQIEAEAAHVNSRGAQHEIDEEIQTSDTQSFMTKKPSRFKTLALAAILMMIFAIWAISSPSSTLTGDRWAGVDWSSLSVEGEISEDLPTDLDGQPTLTKWELTAKSVRACYEESDCPDATNTAFEVVIVTDSDAGSLARKLVAAGLCKYPKQDPNYPGFSAFCDGPYGQVTVQVNIFNPLIKRQQGVNDGLVAGEGWIVIAESSGASYLKSVAETLEGKVIRY